jgi:hypothetical protein
MTHKPPVDMLRSILDSGVNLPEELEFIELREVINILHDFIKVLVGNEEVVFVMDPEGLDEVEVKMVVELGFSHLVDDFEEDVGADTESLELVVTVDLLDGLHVVGLQD